MATVLMDFSPEDVERLENELNERTRRLEQRTTDLKKAIERSQPNYPAKFCCISPMVYHNINEEVPTERRNFCQQCFSNFYFTIFMLLYNLIVSIAGVLSKAKDDGESSDDAKTSDQWQHFGVACVYVVGCFLAFVVWYFPTYKALSTGEKSSYYQAYLGLTVAFLFDIFMTLGLLGYGTCGFLYAFFLRDKKEGKASFYMAIVCAVLWAIQSAFFF
eukprot:PhF_6_TR13014/c0_g1_i2/m.20626/K19995/SCAMP; secretory carrier-associated membrane protein